MVGRPELKFYEAGVDMGWSDDVYESFRIFQGKILEQYEGMVEEFGLHVIDATLSIPDQQEQVRELIKPHLNGLLRKPR